jgi:hypothetical protein
MTREEAIKEIKDMIDSWQKDYAEEVIMADEEIQALNMAIKALEQEPKFIAKSDGTIEQIKDCNNCILSQKTGHGDNIHIPDFSNCKWIFDFNNEVNRTITINTVFLATLADRVDILERKLEEYERDKRKSH